MNENTYLIPANSKKSMLMFGLFNTVDLIIAISGVGLSLVLMLILPVSDMLVAIIALIPGLIAAFLVMPIPNYHNVRTVIRNAIKFYTSRQKYVWRGWCFDYDETDKQ